MSTTKPRKRIGAVVLLRDDGAALLQHRDDKPGLSRAGMWVMPGGHCEPGEAMDVCARREFQEETEYDCRDLTFLGRYDDFDDMTDTYFDLHVYWTKYDGRQKCVCHEGQDLQFIPRSQADQLAVPPLLIETWDASLAAAQIDIPGE